MLLNCGVGEGSWESLGLDCKEMQPVHPEENHWNDWCWIFSPPDAKKWLIWKDPDAGKDWRWEEKGMTEDEVVLWHYQSVNMSLSKLWEVVMDREDWCATVHGLRKSDMIKHLNSTQLNFGLLFANKAQRNEPIKHFCILLNSKSYSILKGSSHLLTMLMLCSLRNFVP